MQDHTAQTTERANRTFGAANDLFWDAWAQSLGMMTWASERGEDLIRAWVDQGRVTREQGLRLQREMMEQARNNQRELQNLIAKTVEDQTETFRAQTEQQIAELRRRMDEIAGELQSFRDRVAS